MSVFVIKEVVNQFDFDTENYEDTSSIREVAFASREGAEKEVHVLNHKDYMHFRAQAKSFRRRIEKRYKDDLEIHNALTKAGIKSNKPFLSAPQEIPEFERWSAKYYEYPVRTVLEWELR